ncbi:NUDIX domain-containing protein [Candidatus Pacearchaeota archaeon]|nr:NUDIX domain-containing protein [Candidatus Pacearchaeota archaeon]
MENQKLVNVEKVPEGLFLVNTLGIIYDPLNKKILIGKRVDDLNVPELSWSFPGGVPGRNEDLEKALEKKILKKTGLKVKSLGNIFSRIPKENNKFLLMYYLCEIISGDEVALDDFTELKWVDPEELEKYFTTSFDSRLKEYIIHLK